MRYLDSTLVQYYQPLGGECFQNGVDPRALSIRVSGVKISPGDRAAG